MSKQIILVDASSLRESACILRFYRIVVEGYRTEINSIDINFGLAFHRYRKDFEETGKAKQAMNDAVEWFIKEPNYMKKSKMHMTPEFLLTTMRDYHMHYEFTEDFETVKSNGRPLVELKFAFPYYVDDEVEVLLVGTIDAVVRHKHAGFYAIKDYKTTSLWDKSSYFEAYRLSTQLMTYTYTLRKYAEFCDLPNNFAKEIVSQGFGAFIDGIFLGNKTTKTTSFERSEVMFFTDRDMREYEAGLAKQIAKLVAAVKDPKSNLFREGIINSSCEKVYGKCNFFSACSAPDEESTAMILANNFIRRQYNPLKFS